MELFGVGLAFYLLGVCDLGMRFWKIQSESWLGVTAEDSGEDTTGCKAAAGNAETLERRSGGCWEMLGCFFFPGK